MEYNYKYPNYYQQAKLLLPEKWYEKPDWWKPGAVVFMLSSLGFLIMGVSDVGPEMQLWEISVAVAIAYIILACIDKKSTINFISFAQEINMYNLPEAIETHPAAQEQITPESLKKIEKIEVTLLTLSLLFPPLGLAIITNKWAAILNNLHLKSRYELAIELALEDQKAAMEYQRHKENYDEEDSEV